MEKPRNNFFGDHIAPLHHALIFSIKPRHLGDICRASPVLWEKHVKVWCANIKQVGTLRTYLQCAEGDMLLSLAKDLCTALCFTANTDAKWRSCRCRNVTICGWKLKPKLGANKRSALESKCDVVSVHLASLHPHLFLGNRQHVLPHFGGTEDVVYPQSSISHKILRADSAESPICNLQQIRGMKRLRFVDSSFVAGEADLCSTSSF